MAQRSGRPGRRALMSRRRLYGLTLNLAILGFHTMILGIL